MAKKTPHISRKQSKNASKARPQSAPVVATPATKVHNPQRHSRLARYKALATSKPITYPVKLPSVWWLVKQTARSLWLHKRLFIGIAVVYGLLNLLLVKGFSSGVNVSTLKTGLESALGVGAFTSSLTIFGVLLSSSGSSSNASGGYQLVLLLIVSLAVIWALREVMAGVHLRIRDAYYRGMYPLIPFVLVLIVVCLQLIPLAFGAAVFSEVISKGIAIYAIEKVLWALLFGLLAMLSLYMVSSSIFALYIVTLPDMTPLRALRSARQLVRHRRWTILRKILVLPLLWLIVAVAVMLPVILVATPLAQWVFYVLTIVTVVFAHAYLYGLYRELLNE